MIPDNVEKVIMTKEDYDRNVEQLLIDKCSAELEIERLNNIIEELEKYLKEQNSFFKISVMGYSYGVTKNILDKLQELKEKQ